MSTRGRRERAPTPDRAVEAPTSAPSVASNPVMDQQAGHGNAAAQERLSDLDHGVDEESGAYGAAESEGWLGSMFQTLDRTIARAQLADRFEVVGDDFQGERGPNQVSQEEFERIATMYSDIRRGDTNIQFADTGNEQNDAGFRNNAMGDIADILTTREGRNLLDDVAYNSVEGNAHSVTLGGVSNPALAGMDMAPGENMNGIFDGNGVDTVLNYAAGQDVDMARANPNFRNADFRHTSSDTVLFHELVHAQRYQNGFVNGQVHQGRADMFSIADSQAVVPNDIGVNEEEYMTVGLMEGSDYTENAYRAQRAQVTGEDIPQRRSYFGPSSTGS